MAEPSATEDDRGRDDARLSAHDQIGKVAIVKKLVKSQAFRVLLALGTLAGSALVLEAGRRWH